MWQKLLCHRYIADRLKDLWNLSQIGANLKTQWHFKILIKNIKLVLLTLFTLKKPCAANSVYTKKHGLFTSQIRRPTC